MKKVVLVSGLLLFLCCSVGCDATTAAVVGGSTAAAVIGGWSPAQEIEQVYYLGVFDPLDQVPATVYRVTVHGQASAISGMKFGSGWVPAALIDSLNTSASFDQNKTHPTIDPEGNDSNKGTFLRGRKLVLFGPEGFREAPADHRLVIVMGSSPEGFFGAIDNVMGQVASVQIQASDSPVYRQLFEAKVQLDAESHRLQALERDLASLTSKQDPK